MNGIAVDAGGDVVFTGGFEGAMVVGSEALQSTGSDDVVIANTGGRLAAYTVKNGSPAQLFNRYVPPEFQGAIVGLFGTPTIGYVDLDGVTDALHIHPS